MVQLSGKLHQVMRMLHGDIMTKIFGNCDSLATCLGREPCQNCWCLRVLFIEINKLFVPIFDQNNLTSPQKCALTSITAPNAEFILVPSAISVNHVMSHIPDSSAPEGVQSFQNPPSSIPIPINPKVLASELQGYNHSLASYLVDGFTFGFKLGCIGEPSLSIHRNHNSVLIIKQLFKLNERKK